MNLMTITKTPRQDSGKGEDWRTRAECADSETYDPELWFPLGDTGPARVQTATAKAVCWSACPVRTECLNWALDERHEDGVWGGLDERERRNLIRSTPVTSNPWR